MYAYIHVTTYIQVEKLIVLHQINSRISNDQVRNRGNKMKIKYV